MGSGCPTGICEKSELVKVIVPSNPPEPSVEFEVRFPLHWPCPWKVAVPHQKRKQGLAEPATFWIVPERVVPFRTPTQTPFAVIGIGPREVEMVPSRTMFIETDPSGFIRTFCKLPLTAYPLTMIVNEPVPESAMAAA